MLKQGRFSDAVPCSETTQSPNTWVNPFVRPLRIQRGIWLLSVKGLHLECRPCLHKCAKAFLIIFSHVAAPENSSGKMRSQEQNNPFIRKLGIHCTLGSHQGGNLQEQAEF